MEDVIEMESFDIFISNCWVFCCSIFFSFGKRITFLGFLISYQGSTLVLGLSLTEDGVLGLGLVGDFHTEKRFLRFSAIIISVIVHFLMSERMIFHWTNKNLSKSLCSMCLYQERLFFKDL